MAMVSVDEELMQHMTSHTLDYNGVS